METQIGGIEIAPGVFAPGDAVRFQFSRSSGPGGQNVNKVNTKAEAWVEVDQLRGLNERARERLIGIAGRRMTKQREIHIASEARRSQEANRAEVMELLRAMVVEAKREPKRRKRTKPTKGAKERRLKEKLRRGEIKAGRRGIVGE